VVNVVEATAKPTILQRVGSTRAERDSVRYRRADTTAAMKATAVSPAVTPVCSPILAVWASRCRENCAGADATSAEGSAPGCKAYGVSGGS
jgi:hypothetical protein